MDRPTLTGAAVVAIAVLTCTTVAGAAVTPAARLPVWSPPEEAATQAPAALDAVRKAEASGAAPTDLAAAVGTLGDALWEAGAHAAAVACYRRQLEVRETLLGPYHPDTGTSLNDLGAYLWETGDTAGARAMFERALTVREKALGPDDPATAETLFNLGQVILQVDGDTAGAQRIYERIIPSLERRLGPEDREVADALIGLASVFRVAGKYAAARPPAERALAIREKVFGPESPEVAEACSILSVIATEAGDLPAALRHTQKALAIREKTLSPDDPDLASSLETLGTVYHEQGDDVSAVPLMRRALAIREKSQGPLHPELAGNLRNLAAVLRGLGDLAGAKPLFERVIAMQRQLFGEASAEVGWSVAALAVVLMESGDLAGARPLFERGIAVLEKTLGPDHPHVANTVSNYSFLLHTQGDLAAARAQAERALAIREKALGPTHPLVGNSLNNVAVIARQQGDIDTARELLKRAETVFVAAFGQEHPEVAAALQNQATLESVASDPAAARALLERALAIREKVQGPTHPAVAGTLLALADVESESGRFDAAAKDAARALAIREARLGPDHLDTAEALLEAAEVDWARGREKEARPAVLRAAGIVDRNVAALLPTLAVAEQRALLGKLIPEHTSWLLSTHPDGRRLEDAYGLLFRWKGLLVEALRREGALALLAGDPALAASADRLRALRAKVAGLYHRAGVAPTEQWRAELAAATAEKEAAERELVRAVKPDLLADRLAATDLSSFRRSLGRGEVLVDVYRYEQHARAGAPESRYAAVLTGPDAAPRLVDLGTAQAVDAAVRAWRLAVLAVRPADEAWRRLAAACWAPLADALPRGTTRVWLAGDGELARVPWQLLPATHPRTRSLLLTQTDSAREVASLQGRRSAPAGQGRTLFLAGGIDFEAGSGKGLTRGGSFEALPSTAMEVERLRELGGADGLAVTLASGAAADKRTVIAALSRSTYVHLATHGFFYQERGLAGGRGAERGATRAAGRNPLVESGIALAGANLRDAATAEAAGLLTAEEIVGLDLSGCDQITLSACDTGRGEEVTGQGVMGLRAACLAAGARRVVMSVWAVPDESTERLMAAFYANLWQRGLPAAEALLRAQEAVRDDPSGRFREPIHWAGWTLAGAGW